MGMQCSEHFRMVRLPTITANSSALLALLIFLILWRRPWCPVQTELTGWARATWACFALLMAKWFERLTSRLNPKLIHCFGMAGCYGLASTMGYFSGMDRTLIRSEL